MNKLTKLSLIAMILTSGAMAFSGSLPGTIESGAVVNVNRDVKLDSCIVTNYGEITTQQTDGNYPTLSGSGTITNMKRAIAEETTNETITSNNALEGISSFKKVSVTKGTVNQNINLDGVNVNDGGNYNLELGPELSTTLVYFGSETEGKEVDLVRTYVGGSPKNIQCSLGDTGGAYGMTIGLTAGVEIRGSLEKLVSSKFVVRDESGSVMLCPNGDVYADFDMSECDTMGLYLYEGKYHGTLNIKSGTVCFTTGTVLESGGVLTIGAAPTE